MKKKTKNTCFGMAGLGSSKGCVGAAMTGFCNWVTFVVAVTPVVGLDDINAVTIPFNNEKKFQSG